MEITLDAIDELRARIDVTYEQACDYLRAAHGDIVEAILCMSATKARAIVAVKTKSSTEGETCSTVCGRLWKKACARNS